MQCLIVFVIYLKNKIFMPSEVNCTTIMVHNFFYTGITKSELRTVNFTSEFNNITNINIRLMTSITII